MAIDDPMAREDPVAHEDANAHDEPTIAATDSTISRDGAALSSPPDFQPPRALGSIELIEELGRGGQSVVWLARHRMLERRVVVKFLRAGAAPDSSGRELHLQRFLEGARAAAALDHPNLNRILHADVAEGIPYLVTDYVDGQSLAQILRTHRTLTLAEAAAVLLDCCEALAVLHPAGILHRDIKPGNILITRDGRAIVTDFGLSGWISGAGQGYVAGTPRYMAPECFEGRFSPRSDVFAAGVMAREMLTGETGTDAGWPTTAAEPRAKSRAEARAEPRGFSPRGDEKHGPRDGRGAQLEAPFVPAEEFDTPTPPRGFLSGLFARRRDSQKDVRIDAAEPANADALAAVLSKGRIGGSGAGWCELIARCTNANAVLRFKSAVQLLESLRRAATRDCGVAGGRERLARRLEGPKAVSDAAKGSSFVVEHTEFHDRLKRFITRGGRLKPDAAVDASPGETVRLGDFCEFEADGLIARDLPCVQCHYLLAGQKKDGRCPECGRAVDQSLESTRYCNMPLRRLRLMLAAQCVLFVLAFFTVADWLLREIFSIQQNHRPLTAGIWMSQIPMLVWSLSWRPKGSGRLRLLARVSSMSSSCSLILAILTIAYPLIGVPDLGVRSIMFYASLVAALVSASSFALLQRAWLKTQETGFFENALLLFSTSCSALALGTLLVALVAPVLTDRLHYWIPLEIAMFLAYIGSIPFIMAQVPLAVLLWQLIRRRAAEMDTGSQRSHSSAIGSAGHGA